MKKSEIISLLEKSREIFLDVLESIPEESLETPGVEGKWSVKDLLVLLNHYEAELIKLLWQVARRGKAKSLNFDDRFMSLRQDEKWVTASRTRDMERILEDFHTIRNQTILRIEGLSDQELQLPVTGRKTQSKPLSEWIADLSYKNESTSLESIKTWLGDVQSTD